MKHKFQIFILVQIFFTFSISAQTSISDPLAIINQNIMVSGGKENLLKVKTVYSELGTEMDGRPVRWITKEMHPNKGCFQILYQGNVVYREFFDGITGYEVIRGEKRLANPDEFKDKIFKKNIFNELDFLDSSLWKLQLIEDDTSEGELCYRIQAKLINGEIRILWYSKKTFFLLRSDKILNAEKNSFSTSLYSDYKKFGELMMWTHLKLLRDDNSSVEGIMISYKINEGVSESDFK